MRRVTGIGGIFFKSADPVALRSWYAQHLGVDSNERGASFAWRLVDNPGRIGRTVWGPFPRDTKYFDPSSAPFMVNYRVSDLGALLEDLRGAGVWVDDRVEKHDYGRFGWILDLEGNRVELWEPTVETDKP